MGGKHLSHEIMKQFHCLALLAAGVASSPIEILNYEAAEAGHGQVMSGTPGEAVMGEFYWKAPEGDDIKLVYTADMAGYVPTGAHLPLSPGLTPEVMEARAAFMDKFAEAQERAEEDMDMAVTAPERRRRDADANAQVLLTQPLHYAPNYPYYFVNNLVPTVKKADETVKKVDEMEMKQYYFPVYAPSYYYPTSLVRYPTTTVTRTVSPWYPVQYPLSYPGLVPQVQQPSEAEEERILPSETQAGENESAALLL